MLIITNVSFGQKDFKWTSIDSLNKTKEQIYSDTKLFIAQNWKSAQDVIQNDDKEAGVILIKGIDKEVINYCMSPYTYYYTYSVTFLMKDGKIKFVLDNVNCSSTLANPNAKYTIPCIPTFEGENYPDVPNYANLSKKKQLELMTNLKANLQSIVDSYFSSIKKPSINTGW